MAQHPLRYLPLIASFNGTRYRYPPQLLSSFTAFRFSTIDRKATKTSNDELSPPPLDYSVHNSNAIEERHVLNQLSDLLPIRNVNRIPNTYNSCDEIAADSNEGVESRGDAVVVDSLLLSPEDRLRGVFLQKLKSRFAIELSLSNVSVDLSLEVVDKVLSRGNLSGESMVVFFRWALKQPMVPTDVRSYNVLVKALGRKKFVDFMLRVLCDLREEGLRPDLETLAIVIDSLLRAHRVDQAIQVFKKSEEYGFERDTESLNVVLQCLCRRSHVGAASSYLNSVKGKIPFNAMTYNVIIGGWSRFGRVSESKNVLEAMLEDGFSPDCSTFAKLIEGLGKARRIKDSVEIFDNMKDKNSAPNTAVYNSIIFNFISIGDLDKCMEYYKRLLSDTCGPNVDTYTSLIAALIKARRVADALELFDEMLHRGIVPATGTITSFLEPLCNFGPPHAAMMIYKKARKVGCKISATSYKLLLMRLSRFGKCGMLFKIWNEMQESGHSSDMEVYKHVISGLCNIGQLENATLVMEEALRKGFCPSRLIYSKLNSKLLAANSTERAYKLFLKIKHARLHENARKFWRSNGWHF